MDILKSLNQDFNAIQKIEDSLFDVVKVQLHPNLPDFESPLSYGMYRESGGKPLGTVGKDFTPQSPKLIFESLLECIRTNEQIDLSKLKYHEMKGGAKVRFEIPIGQVSFKNMIGKEDTSEVSLNIQTGFDGNTKTSLYLSTYRLVCSNGMKASVTEFTTSFKNTPGNVGKALSLCDDIAKGIGNMTKLEEMYQFLNNTKVSQAQVDAFLLKVTGRNMKEYNEYTIQARQVMDKINESVALEFSRTGATAFGLFNGITHYTNHVASEKADDLTEYIYLGTGMSMNDKALKYALEI
jgi:hypothetical protein